MLLIKGQGLLYLLVDWFLTLLKSRDLEIRAGASANDDQYSNDVPGQLHLVKAGVPLSLINW